MSIIYCEKQADIPKQDHWAILGFSDVFTTGYDKGDPDVRVPVIKYTAYTDVEQWKEDIGKLVRSNDFHKYTAMKVFIPKVDITVKVEIK